MNINFLNYVNDEYKLINNKQEAFKKRMFVENDNHLTALNLLDVEKWNDKRARGMQNDLINCVRKIKDIKKYFFLTITLKNFDNKYLANETILENISKQDKILKRFIYLIFKKRNDKKNISLSDLETITKYELTKNNVMHVHVLRFYKDEETIKTIFKRIRNYKKYESFCNVGRIENVVSSRSYSSIAEAFNLKKMFLN